MKEVVEIIRREIAEHGVLSFARFMELALYCPDSGYYETNKDSPGRRGDFYTSVSAGELFGQLLAFQFAEWLHELQSVECGVRIVEAGAHDGTLAKDILSWLQKSRSELFGRIEYCIIEPSVHRREWQVETLKAFAPHVCWCPDLKTLSRVTRHASLPGLIFSNELLDAMPVHRLGWDAGSKRWFEWGVALEGENFTWAKIKNSEPDLPSSILHLPSSFLDVLPDGYTVETCPAAENWWRDAANILEFGRLLTIDYGLTDDELFSPVRTRGTLRAYFRHHVSDDLLANVGEQDITAHINFSQIQTVGETCGLKTEALSTQAQFLTRILERASKDENFSKWGAKPARQFQTLTHPEHLGRAFRVLIQSR